MAAAGETIAAASADDVAFAADDFAGKEVVHIFAGGDDLADEFMADDHRHGDGLLRPRVPFVDVQVGAADAGLEHFDEHVVEPAFRVGDILQPEAAFGFGFDEGFHGVGEVSAERCHRQMESAFMTWGEKPQRRKEDGEICRGIF